MTHRRHILSCGLGLVFLVGCGGSDEARRFPLNGAVKVDGAAVTKGSISFLPAEGNSAQPAHSTISEGAYQFTESNGPFAGAHRVVIGIEATEATDAAGSADQAGEESLGGQGIKEAAAPRRANRYQRAQKPTKLQWEVEYTVPGDGNNQKDFNLSG